MENLKEEEELEENTKRMKKRFTSHHIPFLNCDKETSNVHNGVNLKKNII